MTESQQAAEAEPVDVLDLVRQYGEECCESAVNSSAAESAAVLHDRIKAEVTAMFHTIGVTAKRRDEAKSLLAIEARHADEHHAEVGRLTGEAEKARAERDEALAEVERLNAQILAEGEVYLTTVERLGEQIERLKAAAPVRTEQALSA